MTPGIVAESELNGNLQSEYVFFDGERVARKDFPSNAVSYYFTDHLKTTDIVTDAQGNIKNESDFYPWGGELPFVANDSNHYKFTGKERDLETNLDYFGARYYSNSLGRWMSPDWNEKPEPITYADLSDPQTLNLYGYGRNNPMSHRDGDGHFWQELWNKLRYRVWVDNAHLQGALQQEAQRRLDDLTKRGVTVNGKPAAEVLKGKSNTEIYDAYNNINSQLRIQQQMDDVSKSLMPT